MKGFKKYLAEQNQLPTIYCDMDETIVNFLGGADKVLKKHSFPAWNDPHWKQYSNDRADQIRWDIVKKEPLFWRNLEWMSDGKQLWRFILPYHPHILSHATHYMATCKPEKYQWLVKNLGLNNPAYIHLVDNRGDKSRFAINNNGKPNILIDDYIKNCNDWKAAGGIGIQHTSAANSISQLRKLGFK